MFRVVICLLQNLLPSPRINELLGQFKPLTTSIPFQFNTNKKQREGALSERGGGRR